MITNICAKSAAMMAGLCLYLFSMSAYADKPVINWATSDFPPAFILSGPGQGNGYIRQAINLARQEMVEFDHTETVRTPLEGVKALITNDNVCGGGLHKSLIRQAIMIFSDPLLVRAPSVLVARDSDVNSLLTHQDGSGNISLVDLTRNSSLVLGLDADRTYSTSVDSILDAMTQKKRLYRNEGTNLILRLDQGDVDYLIDTPATANYYLSTLNLKTPLVILPIAEEKNHQPLHFACSRSDLGKKAIKAINKAIKKHGTAMQAGYDAWASF